MESVSEGHIDGRYRAEKELARILEKGEKIGNYNYLSNMDTPMGIISSLLKIARSRIQVRAMNPVSSQLSGIMNTSAEDSETVGTLA